MKTNKTVATIIFSILTVLMILLFCFSHLNIWSNIFITVLLGIGGGKVYTSFCDPEGNLRYKTVKN